MNSRLAQIGQSIFFVEFIYPPRGVEYFLLACVERMANRTHLDLEGVAGKRGAGLEVISATTFYGDFVVWGMNIGFHRSGFFFCILSCFAIFAKINFSVLKTKVRYKQKINREYDKARPLAGKIYPNYREFSLGFDIAVIAM
jgi:hypothetical protein